MYEAENTKRAWSYNAAVDAGLDPQSYAWADIPEGTWPARLDFRIWSNNTSTGHLVCYFTSLVDMHRYRLSAFRPKNQGERRYTAKDGEIDFSCPGLDGKIYLVTIGRNSKGNTTWLTATLGSA